RISLPKSTRDWRAPTLGSGRDALELSGLWFDGDAKRDRPRETRADARHDAALAVVLVHGLGGSAASGYVATTARCLAAAGISHLRVNLRGADLAGGGVYHAALIEDLDVVLASPELARFSRIVRIGFSMGGHLVLRWAMQAGDPRVRGVAAICPPLDLEACADHLDGAGRAVYRSRILRSLKASHAAAHARGLGVAPETHVRALRTLRGWDETVIVPRFGFGNVQAYY